MAWSSIVGALATRIDAVSGISNVYQRQVWTRAAAGTDAFTSLFCTGGVLQTWMITRTQTSSEACQDDDNRYRLRHAVEITGFYALDDTEGGAGTPSETTFQGIVSAVESDLRTGDRTLGGACVTHTLPTADVLHVTFQGATCHLATFRFTVEEIV